MYVYFYIYTFVYLYIYSKRINKLSLISKQAPPWH